MVVVVVAKAVNVSRMRRIVVKQVGFVSMNMLVESNYGDC